MNFIFCIAAAFRMYRKVVVKGVPPDLSEANLRLKVQHLGTIERLEIVGGKTGLIQFSTEDEAMECVSFLRAVKGKDFDVDVKKVIPKPVIPQVQVQSKSYVGRGGGYFFGN